MANSLPNSFFDQMVDIQSLSQRLSASSWMASVESVNNVLGSMNLDAYTEALKSFDTLAELYRKPYYLDTSVFTRHDIEDREKVEEDQASSSSSIESIVAVSENTRVDDINLANEQFRLYLESQTNGFINTLVWTDFEDGMENEVTRQIGEYMEKNRYVTYCWLNKIFNDNRSRPTVTSGLLRTMAMVVNKNDADIMLSMVTSGIASQHSEDQEAAIMVIEKWRTKECLDAMLNTTYGSDWVREYAMQVMAELKEELGI